MINVKKSDKMAQTSEKSDNLMRKKKKSQKMKTSKKRHKLVIKNDKLLKKSHEM